MQHEEVPIHRCDMETPLFCEIKLVTDAQKVVDPIVWVVPVPSNSGK